MWAIGDRDRQEPKGARSTPDAGFVLPGVLLALVLLGAIAVVSMMTTGQERMTGRALRESAKAFYAAEAGANAIIAEWDQAGYDTLLAGPGDSLDLGWRTLENSLSYWAMLRRVDGGSGTRLYTISVTGRGLGVLGGQRVVGVALRTTTTTIELPGAFVFAGSATIGKGGNVIIDGNDNIPPGWGDVCDGPGPAKPGLAVSDTTLITFEDAPTLMGDPPLIQAPFDTLAFDALFHQLVANADITFPPGVEIDDSYQIQPVENPPGVCDTSVPTNWGAPEDPTHPCFDYFPIIYAPGGFNFKTQPDHAGQGIILVEEEAQLENGFSWYGLIMAKGDIQVEQGKSGCEPANIYGGLYTRNDNSKTKLWGPKWFPECQGVVPGSSLFYSSCVMQRIATNTAAASAGPTRPLRQGGWWQTMN